MQLDPKAYAEPCGCGAAAGVKCPHTSIRCKHEFKYSTDKVLSEVEGTIRRCTICGFSQIAEIVWRVTPPLG